MDKKTDILILFMTSHGDRNGVALQLPDITIDLTPQKVAETLNREGIKNRVVIVSACFSGIFVPPLRNDSTIVMTASDQWHTSFGCAPERDWTYFGDALLRLSLHPGTDFEHAFEKARELIAGWELMDRAPPSNPQGFFGPALVAKLRTVLRRLGECHAVASVPSAIARRRRKPGAPAHATRLTGPHDLSDAHKPRSRRKRSAGRRRIYGADAREAHAGPLEAALFQHPPRNRVADARTGLQRLVLEIAESVVDHRAHCLGRIAAAPIGHAEPIADLGAALAWIDAASADQLAIERMTNVASPSRLLTAAMNCSASSSRRDAAGGPCSRRCAGRWRSGDRLCVRATRRTQNEPLGPQRRVGAGPPGRPPVR